jgi:hypothetical protein
MRTACWVVFVACLLLRQAAARDIFVDNLGGDDKCSGLHTRPQADASGPVRTIAKALRLAQAGDHVVLAKSAQPYHECVSLVGTRHSGAGRLMPFVLDGNGAVLDGSTPIPVEGWSFYRDNIFRFRPQATSGPILFLNGRALHALPLPQTTAVPPRLKPLQWCVLEGAIYFAVEPSRLPPDYKLNYTELPTGITLYQVEQVVIRNLVIRGFRADGVAAAVGARNVVLEKVVCTANGQSGVCVQGGAKVEIASCKLAGNGRSQLLTLANSETRLLASELINDTARGWVDEGGRVYLGATRIEGGRKAIRPDEAPMPDAQKPVEPVPPAPGPAPKPLK